MSGTLFKRIKMGKGERLTVREIDQVLDNLSNVFNTRKGSIPLDKDFGIPDFNDLIWEFPEVVVEVKKAILENIRKFEPRLENTRVRHVKDEENPLSLKFEISANLKNQGESSKVKFTTIMGEAGRVRVQQ